jgi:hypothetical protein
MSKQMIKKAPGIHHLMHKRVLAVDHQSTATGVSVGDKPGHMPWYYRLFW